MSASSQYELADPPTDAISSVKFAPTSSSKLLVASWDSFLYHYDIKSTSGQLLNKFQHRAPILDVCYGEDDGTAFTVGLDHDVRRIDLNTGTQTVLSTHGGGVRSIVYDSSRKLLISSSWDSTLHIHNLSSSEKSPQIYSIPLPGKPFSLSCSTTKLVVAMSARALHIYELSALATHFTSVLSSESDPTPPEPWQRRESSLKFMTRAVACMPTDLGYASSSIEGRVAVEWFDPSAASQARKYAFKCHRQTSAGEETDPIDIVYPVNALAFHPIHGTFASGGGDGCVALWDGVAKRRIRLYQRYTNSVAALAFSSDGKILAVAVCPGFEDGKDVVAPTDADAPVRVYIRELGATETKGKSAK